MEKKVNKRMCAMAVHSTCSIPQSKVDRAPIDYHIRTEIVENSWYIILFQIKQKQRNIIIFPSIPHKNEFRK